MDILDYVYDLEFARLLSVFEAIVVDDYAEDTFSSPEDGGHPIGKRQEFRRLLKNLEINGTIGTTSTGWTNDEPTRQPGSSNKYPRSTVPTENGYPGLEPPVG